MGHGVLLVYLVEESIWNDGRVVGGVRRLSSKITSSNLLGSHTKCFMCAGWVVYNTISNSKHSKNAP